jgi:hypothetical protein
MAYGLLDDEPQRQRWLEIVAQLRNVPTEDANQGSGYGAVFDALVLLHRDRPRAAWSVLGTSDAGGQWHAGLLCQWRAALSAEAAVLADRRDKDQACRAATSASEGNPIAAALTERARALSTGDADVLDRIAERFVDLDLPYQAERTRKLSSRRCST